MITTLDLVHIFQNNDDTVQADNCQPALDTVNLTVEQGEFLAVLGRNGSGKSTLARHFNALLLPTGGKVMVKNMDSSDKNCIWDIRQTVGMVFQNPDNQIVATIVEEDVAFGPENLGVPPREIAERVEAALKQVGLYEYRKHAPHLLSGGQKQKLAIAGILAMRPQCIVLDEPTAMLDPAGRKDVLDTVRCLNKEQGITIVLITHYVEETVEADRIIIMDKGKIMLSGSPEEIFSNYDGVQSLGIDLPQVTELAHYLNSNGINIPSNILTVDRCVEEIIKVMPFKHGG